MSEITTEAGKRLLAAIQSGVAGLFAGDEPDDPSPIPAAIAAIEAEALGALSPLVNVTHEDDGSWSIQVNAMPGHVGAAWSVRDAAAEAHDAALSWVEALRDG